MQLAFEFLSNVFKFFVVCLLKVIKKTFNAISHLGPRRSLPVLMAKLCKKTRMQISVPKFHAKFFNLFARLFILFYFRSEKFRTSVNGKLK